MHVVLLFGGVDVEGVEEVPGELGEEGRGAGDEVGQVVGVVLDEGDGGRDGEEARRGAVGRGEVPRRRRVRHLAVQDRLLRVVLGADLHVCGLCVCVCAECLQL